jgi:hypothetical protein
MYICDNISLNTSWKKKYFRQICRKNKKKSYGMFTVHFYKIENNDIQQMHFNTFIRYTNTSTCFGPSGPSSGSYKL